MSIANALGEMFRRELEAQMVPLQQAVRRLDEGLEALELLRTVTERLAPLSSRLGAMAGVRPSSTVLPRPAAARGRRPLAVAGPGRAAGGDSKACAIIGCERQSRSKGYCSAHYQKLRLLMKTNRRPANWVDDASPQSVEDVKLPRGRAASKALRESPPVAAPKPARGRPARKAPQAPVEAAAEDVTPPSRRGARRAARKGAAATQQQPAEAVKPPRGRAAGKKAARKGAGAKKAAAKKAPAQAPRARKAAGAKKAAAKKGARKSARR